MVFAAPELVIAEPVELLDEVEIAAELQQRMLADRMVGSEEGAEIQSWHQGFSVECGEGLLHALDDPQVTIRTLAESLQRFLIARAVMGGRRFLDAVELDDDGALEKAGLVGLGRRSARQKPPAGSLDRRAGELGVAGQRIRVRNRTIRRHPIRLCHRHLLFRRCGSSVSWFQPLAKAQFIGPGLRAWRDPVPPGELRRNGPLVMPAACKRLWEMRSCQKHNLPGCWSPRLPSAPTCGTRCSVPRSSQRCRNLCATIQRPRSITVTASSTTIRSLASSPWTRRSRIGP